MTTGWQCPKCHVCYAPSVTECRCALSFSPVTPSTPLPWDTSPPWAPPWEAPSTTYPPGWPYTTSEIGGGTFTYAGPPRSRREAREAIEQAIRLAESFGGTFDEVTPVVDEDGVPGLVIGGQDVVDEVNLDRSMRNGPLVSAVHEEQNDARA